MIKVEKIKVCGFEPAISGMRNPYDSWGKSDSKFSGWMDENHRELEEIGETDMELMRKLYKAGPEHRKYLRQIFVWMDITAPFYWWKQFDKYQIGVTTNSCSTMHTITKKPFELSDFSIDISEIKEDGDAFLNAAQDVIDICEAIREHYILTKDPALWRLLIQLLPESYNQKRTVTMNYEVAATIIKQRAGHRLKEWNDFIDILKKELPNLSLIMEA